jgi:midasin
MRGEFDLCQTFCDSSGSSFKASEDNNGGTDQAMGKQLQTRRHAETPSSLGDRMRGNPEERLERMQDVMNPIEAEAAEDIAMEQMDGENAMQYSHDADDRWQALGPSGESEPAKLQSVPEMDPVTEDLGDATAQDHMDHFNVDMQLEPSDLISGLKHSQPAEVFLNDVGFSVPSVKSLSLEDRKDEFPSKPLEEPKTTRTARDIQDAESIWRLLEAHTHDLSLLLCEQLRLILEPTLAARLKGDYRTGKRLNMKKIIPYIASEYTKDKIWLRRTKPSRREYQILISLDDSKSMGESQSISLAFHTLALVTMALNRLEVGDVAVAKFGESTEIVHEFGDGSFTSHVGARVINSFAFNQRATDVLRLVDYTINFLSEARRNKVASASAMDLWQLQIIISDGICQDHERLRTLLRLAEEKRIMIVFIVLDSLHSTADQGNDNSILTMNQVGYKTVAGRQEIEMRQYMDTFPFDYYAILRDVRSLPEILSSTLQQFFERLAEQ